MGKKMKLKMKLVREVIVLLFCIEMSQNLDIILNQHQGADFFLTLVNFVGKIKLKKRRLTYEFRKYLRG